jgi:hypothetical protein
VNRDDCSAAEDAARFQITRRSAVLVVAWGQAAGVRTTLVCPCKLCWCQVSAFVALRCRNADQRISMLREAFIPPHGALEP